MTGAADGDRGRGAEPRSIFIHEEFSLPLSLSFSLSSWRRTAPPLPFPFPTPPSPPHPPLAGSVCAHKWGGARGVGLIAARRRRGDRVQFCVHVCRPNTSRVALALPPVQSTFFPFECARGRAKLKPHFGLPARPTYGQFESLFIIFGTSIYCGRLFIHHE